MQLGWIVTAVAAAAALTAQTAHALPPIKHVVVLMLENRCGSTHADTAGLPPATHRGAPPHLLTARRTYAAHAPTRPRTRPPAHTHAGALITLWAI